jgi:anti-sigma-K factor RskA
MSSDSDRYGRAGDYVMGRMEPAERERAERDLERDPKFREAVLRLSERIRRGGTVADLELWRSVEAGLNDLPQMREALASPTSASGRAKRAGRPPVPSHPLTGWKGALLVAGVAAACGASYIAGDRTADPGAPEMVVTLTDANGGVGGILEVGDDDMLRFVPLALDGRTGSEAPRLWTIYDETIGYVPLGTLLAAEARRWRGPDLPPPVPGQRYRVTSGAGAAAVPDGLVLFEGSARAVGGR